MSVLALPTLWRFRNQREPTARDWQRLRQIQSRIVEFERLSDRDVTDRAIGLRDHIARDGTPLDADTLIDGCTLVREAVRRTSGRSLYPVQLVAGMILANGSIAEMQTGEGKTLTSALPGFLCALRFPGVHVATPNAYLAERDCHELRPAYELLGLRVGLLPEKHDATKSRAAYQCDLTYGTGYDFGFDFLRDQLALRQRPALQLGQHTILALRGTDRPETEQLQTVRSCALIDEIDSVLLDEAMTPLILSVATGQARTDDPLYRLALRAAEQLERGSDYQIDATAKSARLTPTGVARVFEWLENPGSQSRQRLGFAEPPTQSLATLATTSDLSLALQRPWTQYVEQALHAKFHLHRDIDYVVREGKVEIVDQKTGRIFSERSWRAGLHQAVEMREGVELSDDKTSAARITRQRYFQLYRSLAGMTGTATGAEAEFSEFYKLNVVTIPLHRPSQRQLLPDRFFASTAAKFEAVAREAAEHHRHGRPVLIGTRTILDSERLSGLLTERRIEHLVLNGKQDQAEADIIASAGHAGRVTIATNMAGRGTDIKLDERGLAAGGLQVIGVERYESRRIDRQLAGRAARAGAPGTARFFLSAEDELLSIKAPQLARRIRSSAGREGESRGPYARAVEALQAACEIEGFHLRRSMVHRDRWLEQVVDSLCRETAG